MKKNNSNYIHPCTSYTIIHFPNLYIIYFTKVWDKILIFFWPLCAIICNIWTKKQTNKFW